ncbi:hypothetical protein PT015_06235 [Candidatus Mycobacterium wuenschmannii]|uniref:Uncharacterized protein n=1 Tax=Candidatus Mycobacterium wuenschmannii TaxID=3027808 RepID=A0ABY8W3S1_9MYCO|nr:hypothetical protein [Candidatus Mycobacterium wuenschmannii]WIM89063.1 hypothetical protein PT015_06235 [Candidatus Mycobacterium wuenschmannii]
MGILFGFAPWIVYWILVGDAPPLIAAVVAFATAVAGLAAGYLARTPRRSLEIGSGATFLVLTVLTATAGGPALQRWGLPLSFAALLATTLLGRQFGASFVHEYAASNQPPSMVNSDVFGQITARLTWIWIAVFAGMTVSVSVVAVTLPGAQSTASYLGYRVLPAVLFGLGALATRVLPDWMIASAGDIERKTTFVAYHEATIDELYYLAQEHANREVGAGEEAYAVKVGGKGTALVGDETRHSWPSTYKVRQARR